MQPKSLFIAGGALLAFGLAAKYANAIVVAGVLLLAVGTLAWAVQHSNQPRAKKK